MKAAGKPTLVRLPKAVSDYLDTSVEQTRRVTGRNASIAATARAIIAAAVAVGIDLSGSEADVQSRVSNRLAGSAQ